MSLKFQSKIFLSWKKKWFCDFQISDFARPDLAPWPILQNHVKFWNISKKSSKMLIFVVKKCSKKKTCFNKNRKSSEATFISLTEYLGPRLFIPFLQITVFWDAQKYRISLCKKNNKKIWICVSRKYFQRSAFCYIFCSPKCSHWRISRIKWYSGKFQILKIFEKKNETKSCFFVRNSLK